MKLKMPLTFSQCLWALPLTGLFVLGMGAALEHFLQISILDKTLIGLCITGAFLGASMQFGILRVFLRCPTCGSSGELTFGYQSGRSKARPLFDCPKCGRLVNQSRIAIKVRKEEESVCPECGYEFKDGEQGCPHCSTSNT